MAIEQQRWTIDSVQTRHGTQWTYTLRGKAQCPETWLSAKAAARAAERAWKNL